MKHKFRTIGTIYFAVICLAMFASLTGCDSNKKAANISQTKFEALAELTPKQQAQKELAISAKDKLFVSLSGELMKSMGEKGPANSISVCKTRAPEIAARVGKEASVRIGRTSFKLRNASNKSPDWAASYVENKVENPIEVALPNNELGILLPIRLNATCTLCHGTNEQVVPEVKAAIVSNYPDDKATGFAEGDIRGYFWIEVPSESQNEE